MTYLILFSRKKKQKNIINLLSAESAHSKLSVKNMKIGKSVVLKMAKLSLKKS